MSEFIKSLKEIVAELITFFCVALIVFTFYISTSTQWGGKYQVTVELQHIALQAKSNKAYAAVLEGEDFVWNRV